MGERIKIITTSTEPEVVNVHVTARPMSDDPTEVVMEVAATRTEPEVKKIWVAFTRTEPEIMKVPITGSGESESEQEPLYVWVVASKTEMDVSKIPVTEVKSNG
jgi:hypothetical protein